MQEAIELRHWSNIWKPVTVIIDCVTTVGWAIQIKAFKLSNY